MDGPRVGIDLCQRGSCLILLKRRPSMEQISAIGLDTAKQYFQVHGADNIGNTVLRRKLRRNQVLKFFTEFPRCRVGIEACSTAHHWSRAIAALGHEVRLIPPQYVKPFVKRSKTDASDAEAIYEAMSRPTMRFVTVKSKEQQAALMVHRARDVLVRQRTQLSNSIRNATQSRSQGKIRSAHSRRKIRESRRYSDHEKAHRNGKCAPERRPQMVRN